MRHRPHRTPRAKSGIWNPFGTSRIIPSAEKDFLFNNVCSLQMFSCSSERVNKRIRAKRDYMRRVCAHVRGNFHLQVGVFSPQDTTATINLMCIHQHDAVILRGRDPTGASSNGFSLSFLSYNHFFVSQRNRVSEKMLAQSSVYHCDCLTASDVELKAFQSAPPSFLPHPHSSTLHLIRVHISSLQVRFEAQAFPFLSASKPNHGSLRPRHVSRFSPL